MKTILSSLVAVNVKLLPFRLWVLSPFRLRFWFAKFGANEADTALLIDPVNEPEKLGENKVPLSVKYDNLLSDKRLVYLVPKVSATVSQY